MDDETGTMRTETLSTMTYDRLSKLFWKLHAEICRDYGDWVTADSCVPQKTARYKEVFAELGRRSAAQTAD